jgi:hypothetical protein
MWRRALTTMHRWRAIIFADRVSHLHCTWDIPSITTIALYAHSIDCILLATIYPNGKLYPTDILQDPASPEASRAAESGESGGCSATRTRVGKSTKRKIREKHTHYTRYTPPLSRLVRAHKTNTRWRIRRKVPTSRRLSLSSTSVAPAASTSIALATCSGLVARIRRWRRSMI